MAEGKKSKIGAIAFTIIILLIVGGLTVFMEKLSFSSYEQKWKKEVVRHRLTMLAENLAGSVIDLLIAKDKEGMRWRLEELMNSHKGVVYGIVVDKEDRVIAAAGINIKSKKYTPLSGALRQTGTSIAFDTTTVNGKVVYQVGVPIMPEGRKIRLGSVYLGGNLNLIAPQEYKNLEELRKKIFLWTIVAWTIALLVVLIGMMSIEGGVQFPENVVPRVIFTSSDSYEHVGLLKAVLPPAHFKNTTSIDAEFEHFVKEGLLLMPFIKERENDVIYGFISAPEDTTDSYIVASLLRESLLKTIKGDLSIDAIFDQVALLLDFIVLRGPKLNLFLMQIDKENGRFNVHTVGDVYFADIKNEQEGIFKMFSTMPIGAYPTISDALLPGNMGTYSELFKSAIVVGVYPDESILERLNQLIEDVKINPMELEKLQDLGGFGALVVIKA